MLHWSTNFSRPHSKQNRVRTRSAKQNQSRQHIQIQSVRILPDNPSTNLQSELLAPLTTKKSFLSRSEWLVSHPGIAVPQKPNTSHTIPSLTKGQSRCWSQLRLYPDLHCSHDLEFASFSLRLTFQNLHSPSFDWWSRITFGLIACCASESPLVVINSFVACICPSLRRRFFLARNSSSDR